MTPVPDAGLTACSRRPQSSLPVWDTTAVTQPHNRFDCALLAFSVLSVTATIPSTAGILNCWHSRQLMKKPKSSFPTERSH
jgi:hypothetical protein